MRCRGSAPPAPTGVAPGLGCPVGSSVAPLEEAPRASDTVTKSRDVPGERCGPRAPGVHRPGHRPGHGLARGGHRVGGAGLLWRPGEAQEEAALGAAAHRAVSASQCPPPEAGVAGQGLGAQQALGGTGGPGSTGLRVDGAHSPLMSLQERGLHGGELLPRSPGAAGLAGAGAGLGWGDTRAQAQVQVAHRAVGRPTQMPRPPGGRRTWGQARPGREQPHRPARLARWKGLSG